jgi:sugar lactone lactonase YvrE
MFVAFSSVAVHAQVTIARPATPRIMAIAKPEVPLLIGLNSGAVIQVDDMSGGATQTLGDGFWQGRTTAAPVVARGINGQLVALVPGDYPKVQVLLPSPDWQMLDSRTGPLVNFTIDATGGVLYGVNCQSGTIVRYDMVNKVSQMLGSKGTGLGQLECPEKIAVDAQGRIYVADMHRVVRMNDITGNGWTAFGSHGSGNGEFNYIRGLAVDSKGRIYVSDYFNNRIVRMDDMNGGGWTAYSVGISQPEGIAVDAYDRLYIAMPVGNKVVRLDDMTGAGIKTLQISRDAGYAGPNVIVPLKRVTGRPVIR